MPDLCNCVQFIFSCNPYSDRCQFGFVIGNCRQIPPKHAMEWTEGAHFLFLIFSSQVLRCMCSDYDALTRGVAADLGMGKKGV